MSRAYAAEYKKAIDKLKKEHGDLSTREAAWKMNEKKHLSMFEYWYNRRRIPYIKKASV